MPLPRVPYGAESSLFVKQLRSGPVARDPPKEAPHRGLYIIDNSSARSLSFRPSPAGTDGAEAMVFIAPDSWRDALAA